MQAILFQVKELSFVLTQLMDVCVLFLDLLDLYKES